VSGHPTAFSTGQGVEQPSRIRRALVAGNFIALIIACGLVLFLAARLRSLSTQYGELRRRASLPFPGFVVPTFRGATIAGDSVTIGDMRGNRGAQVLFVFNTRCAICKATIPAWNAIGDSLNALRTEVLALGISLDSLPETKAYARAESLRYPVIRFPDPKLAVLFRAGAVPQTLVINERGVVGFARVGRLDPPGIDSLFMAVKQSTK